MSVGKSIKIEDVIDKAKELQNFEIKDTSEYTYITDHVMRKYAEGVQTIDWYYNYSLLFIIVGIILTVLVSIIIYTRITEYKIKHALITVGVMVLTVAPAIFLFANLKVKEDIAETGREYIALSNDFNKQIVQNSTIVTYGLDKINNVEENDKGETIADLTLLKVDIKAGGFDELRYEGKVTGYIKGMKKEDVKQVDIYVVEEKYYPFIGSNINKVDLIFNEGK